MTVRLYGISQTVPNHSRSEVTVPPHRYMAVGEKDAPSYVSGTGHAGYVFVADEVKAAGIHVARIQ